MRSGDRGGHFCTTNSQSSDRESADWCTASRVKWYVGALRHVISTFLPLLEANLAGPAEHVPKSQRTFHLCAVPPKWMIHWVDRPYVRAKLKHIFQPTYCFLIALKPLRIVHIFMYSLSLRMALGMTSWSNIRETSCIVILKWKLLRRFNENSGGLAV